MSSHDATTHSFPPESAGDAPAATAVEPRLKPGTRLGQFTVVRKVGGGGMGVVYEAVQDQPKRSVALKIILKEWPSERDLARFREEAELLARAEHAHIATVIEAGSSSVGEDRIAYIAMQYVNDARTITQFATHRNLSRRKRLELFAKVCRAVHWAHERGVIHRDLKPENILVDGSGEPRVIDFGIAKLNFSPTVGTAAHQGTLGHFVGSLPWAAPEQVRGGDAVDRRTDVYALGLVLYRLMCGTHAYDLSRSTDSEAMLQIQNQPPTPPSTFDGALRGEAERLIIKALDKDPKRRYQSALELAEDVDRLLDGRLVDSGESGGVRVLPRSARRFTSKHPYAALGIIAVLSIVLVNELGAQLVFRWTPLNAKFESWLQSSEPGTDVPMSHVRILERNFEDSPEGLAGAGLPPMGLDATKFGWKRMLYAKVLDRLVAARPSVVVMDHDFPTADAAEPTAALVASIARLKAAGIDTVVVGGGPDTSVWQGKQPEIAALAGMANGLVNWGDPGRVLSAPLLWQTPGLPPVPSLALRSLVAARHPGMDAEYSVDELRRRINIRYFQTSADSRRTYPKIHDAVSFTSIESFSADIPALGVRAGDCSYMLAVDAKDRDANASSIVTYTDFFAATPEALQEMFRGRAAFLAGSSISDPDVLVLDSGDRVWHPLSHARALQRLLAGSAIITPSAYGEYLVVAFGAILGVGIAALGKGRADHTIELAIAAVVLLVAASVIAFKSWSILCNPWMPLLATLVACALSFLVFRLHRRHRLLVEIA